MTRTFRQSPLHAFALRLITAVFTAQSMLVAWPAAAQIVPDKQAPSGTRALVDAAANGVPLLHIAPPSKAGVSRNVYEQFNVQQQGLILNNSKDNVQTQLGGWITGNLQLGLTPARIILNEVSGTSRSELRGTIEVAGQRADIVIANPNGILCDGCGFLNADRATLTTGKPQFGEEGAIKAFDVLQGTVQIGAGGLNATEQQQLDLYARGLVVDGEVWAKKLQAVVGANRVLHGTIEELPNATPIAGTGETPRFAVDIKELGGMFAGRIYLIATDKGLGVNSSGRMASLAGNLDLTAQGDLTLKDTYASGQVGIVTVGKLTTTGQTLAGEQVAITAPAGWTNSGVLQTPLLALATPKIDNSGSIAQTAPGANLSLQLPQGLANSGAIYTPGDLTVQAAGISSGAAAKGELLAGGNLTIAGQDIDLRGQQLSANGMVNVEGGALRLVGGGITAGANVDVRASSQLDVSGTSIASVGAAHLSGATIALDGAKVAAQGDVRIDSAGAFTANGAELASNTAVIVRGTSVDLRAATLSAAGDLSIATPGGMKLDASQLAAGERIDLQAQGISTAGATVSAPKLTLDAGKGALDNELGKILASSPSGDALVVRAVGINNQGGELRANGALVLDAGGALIDNTRGVIAGTSGSLTHLGELVNARGVLYTQSDLALSGFALNNAAGSIATAGNLSVITPGRSIDNTGGVLQAGGDIVLDAGSAQLKNSGGTVSADGSVTVTAGAINSNSGAIVAGEDLIITTGSLQAKGGKFGSGNALILTVSGDAMLNKAVLSSGGELALQASDVQATGAKATSGTDLTLTVNNIHGGQWSARGDVTATAQGTLDVSGGGLIAGGDVRALAGDGIVTDGAQVAGRSVELDAGQGALSNVGGTIVASGTGPSLVISSSGIDNTRGVIASSGDAAIDARGLTVDNTAGTIQAVGTLDLKAGQLLNHGGTLNSAGSLSLRGFALDNESGTIQAGAHLTIDTAGQALNNNAGRLIAQGDANIAAGAMTNAGGTIYAGGNASVQATSLDTTGGRITGTRQMDVFIAQSLTGRNTAFASEGQVGISAAAIDAQGASVQAGTSVSVTSTGALDVSGAAISALGAQAGDIRLAGASVIASGAKVAGDAAVSLASASTLDVANASVTALKSLTLQAPGALSADGAQLKTNDQLDLDAASVSANSAALSAAGNVRVSASSGAANLAGAALVAGNTATVTATQGIAATGASIGAVGDVSLTAGAGNFDAAGVLVQSQTASIAVQGANVNVAGSPAASAATGLIAAQQVTVTASGAVDASHAVIAGGTTVQVDAQGSIANRGGQIVADTRIALSGASLDNDGGLIDANGPIGIALSDGIVSNNAGRITTRDVLTLTGPAGGALASLANRGGTINSTGALNLNLRDFDNAGGNVTALTGLTVNAGAVDNTAGTLASQGDVAINASGAFLGADSYVTSAQRGVALSAGATNLTGASVLGERNVTITSAQLDAQGVSLVANTGALRIDAGRQAVNLDDAKLAAAGAISLAAGDTMLSRAAVASGSSVTLSTDSLQANATTIDAQTSIAATARAGAIAANDARFTAGTTVTLSATQGIALERGAVSGATLTIDAGSGALNNAGGAITAVQTLDVRSTGLDNRAGVVAANGDVTINAAQAGTATAADNRAGVIRSVNGGVQLTTGALENSRATIGDAGSVITAAGDVSIRAAGDLNNTRSEISSGSDLTVAASESVANDSGRLIATRDAMVAGSAIANTQGLIAANGSLQLTAGTGGVTNTQGLIQAGGDLLVQSQGIVANSGSTLQAGGQLSVTGTALSNDQGRITAQAGGVTLDATSYTGQNAAVIAGGALSVNTHGGTLAANEASFASQGSMTLTAGPTGITQLTDATLVSGASMTLTSGALQADRVNAQAAGDLSVTAGGSLQSATSTWLAGQSVSLNATGAVALQDATVFGNTGASVRGQSVDATRASIQSPGDVSVVSTSGALNITDATLSAGRDLVATGTGAGSTAGALVAAGRDLTLGNGSYFDFAAPDLQYQFGRDLTVRAQGINTAGLDISARNLTLDAGGALLNNAGGTLQATGNVSASGTGVDNTGGTIVANGQVTADAGSGTLANTAGRIVSIQGSTRVGGGVIDNADGLVSGAVDVAITGGKLVNTGNTIVAGRNLTANMSGSVDNAGGRLIANTGAARISANGIDNTSGTISGATTATADAGSGTLENTGGLVAGTNVTIGGAVDNRAGVISGSNSVSMTTRAVDNDAGVIESGAGGIRIDTRGNLLTNTNSGTTRGIVSKGDITIASGALNSQTGYIGADGTLAITASGNVDNRQGTLLGLEGVTLNAGTAAVDNRAGSITSGGNVTITAGTLNNTGAGSTVFAEGNLSVTVSGALDNSGTKTATYTSGLLAGGNATISAATIDNTNGAIVALGTTDLRATTRIVNAGGQIAGNTISITTPEFTNTAGRADAQAMLTMNAPVFSADGVLASNGGMALTMQGDQVNTGTWSANGSFSLTTSGSITNQGHISAMGGLTLTGTAIDNQSGAVIDAPDSVTLNSTGIVTNAGLINANAGATTINAATLNNTGRIYGDSVTITAATTNNNPNTAGVGAVIASRGGDIAINGDLNNTGESLVLSLGNIAISGRTANDGSTIDAAGDIRFGGALHNTNSNFSTEEQTRTETYSPAKLYITPTFDTTRYDASTLRWTGDTGGHWILPSETYPFATFGSAYKPTSYQCVYQGGDAGAPTCDYVYQPGDAIWSLMGVTSPPPAPTNTDPYNCELISGDGSVARNMMGACGTYWSSYDSWYSQLMTSYDRLDTKIAAFNADLDSRMLIDWYETNITGASVTETLVKTSRPGEVRAGGNITALGGGLNDKSVIVARGTVDVSIADPGVDGTRVTSETGTIAFSHRTWSGGFSSSYGRELSAPQPIADAPIRKTIPLTIDAPGYVAPPISSTTPVGAQAATVPTDIGASVKSARGGTGASSTTGTVAGGNASAVSGSAVDVATRQTTTAASADAPDSVQNGSSGSLIQASTINGAQTSTQTVQLSTAVETPLPGSVIAADVRAGQAQTITALQTSFAQKAAAVPQYPQTLAVKTVTAPPAIKDAGYKTVGFTGAVRAPNNQMFRLNTSPTARYLVETDPAFTNFRQWASSAWMLTQLSLDPERQLKLYGDGFAEQQLIDNQIVSLTGRRYLAGYSSTEEEYRALMNAGVMFAKQYQLTPGMALSAAQMATLTTDIVWLEEREVALPDGTTARALVPVVYLRRLIEGDITPVGSLIAGSNVNLRSTGDVTNGGTLFAYGDAAAGDGKLTVDGANVTNTGTFAGNQITVKAAGTYDGTGGTIKGVGANSNALVEARDIVLATTTQASTASVEGPNGTSTGSRTNVDRVATITADSVKLAALNDITLTGAVVKATGDLSVIAGGKITATTVQETYTLDVPLGGAGGTSYGRTGHMSQASTTNFGTQLTAGGNATVAADGAVSLTGATIDAGKEAVVQGTSVEINAAIDKVSIDQQGVSGSGYERLAQSDGRLSGGVINSVGNLTITATAGDVTANGAVITSKSGATKLAATGDVNLGVLQTESSTTYEHATSSNGTLSQSSSVRANSASGSYAQGTSVSGATVVVDAGRDVNITGSSVVSDTSTQIKAARDVSIVAATDTLSASSYSQDSKSGFGAMGGLSFGSREQSTGRTTEGTKSVASTVGSLLGDVTISAGGTYSQIGSDIVVPVGNADIEASKVNIAEARETSTTETEQKFRQSGISVSASNPILDTLMTVGQLERAASRTDDPRAQALAVATMALAASNTAAALAKNPAAATSVGINISLGTTKSESNSTEDSNTAAGSSILAGGDIRIKATGAGSDSTVTVQGSTIKATNDASVEADGVVSFLAAQNTNEQHSTNSTSSASVGIGINFGSQSGVSFNAGADSGRGNSDGSDVTNVYTHVTAGNTLTIKSGGDANIIGAVVGGKTVVADIGGDLNIESLQDTSTFDGKQTSAGFGVSVCVPPLCAGASSVSVNASKANASGDYASVIEQAGIKAGDGGFQVNVQGNTDLKGGVIASSRKAIDEELNSLSTGSLTYSDIENRDNYDASGFGIGVTFGRGLGDQGSATTPDQKRAAAGASSSSFAGSAGIGSSSGSQGSVTPSGISEGSIKITNGGAQQALTGQSGDQAIAGVNRNVTTETDSSGALTQVWNGGQLLTDVQAQTQITTAFTGQARIAVSNYVAGQRQVLQDRVTAAKTAQEKTDAQKELNDLNTQERALNILIGAVTGTVGAAITKESLSAAAQQMRELMIEDSKKFPGITDGTTILTNTSGPSEGVNGDGVKVGGTRVDLDALCGVDNVRCKTNTDGSLELNEKGQVLFNAEAAGMSLAEYLNSPEGRQMSGATGGIQGMKGTLFGIPYLPGSWQDKLIEAFSGTHDMIGGKLSGLYDGQGNATRDRPQITIKAQDIWSATGAIALSTPFAAAELLSPEIWQAISVLLEAAR